MDKIVAALLAVAIAGWIAWFGYQIGKDIGTVQGIVIDRQMPQEYMPIPPAEPLKNKNMVYTEYQPHHDVLASYISKKYHVSYLFSLYIVDTAYNVAERTRNDPLMLLAIIGVESAFNPWAKGPADEIGLMQIHPKWQSTLILEMGGEWPMWQPEQNILAGARILGRNIRSAKDLPHALLIYNGGPQYVGRVINKYLEFQRVIRGKSTKGGRQS